MNEGFEEDINEVNDEQIYMLLNVHEHYEDQLLKIYMELNKLIF